MWNTIPSPATHLPDDAIPACTRRPNDWFPESAADLKSHAAEGAVTACRRCPLRQGCARVALDDPTRVYGIWAGVYLPIPSSATQAGQRRTALHVLRGLAGYAR